MRKAHLTRHGRSTKRKQHGEMYFRAKSATGRKRKLTGMELIQALEPRLMMAVQLSPFTQSISLQSGSDMIATPAATVALTVNGVAQWTDTAGGKHGVPLATVEIRTLADAPNAAPKATLQTDDNGNFSGPVSIDLGGGNAADVYARIYARNAAADVKPDAVNAKTYFMDTDAVHVTSAGSITFPTKVAASDGTNAEKAYSIMAAELQAATYAVYLAIPLAKMPSQLDTRFPSNQGAVSFFSSSPSPQMFITPRRVFDWDVIEHEYGHYVADAYSFAASPGGSHSSGVANPKPGGQALAWSEGWASYFSISGQLLKPAPYAAGVPNVGDTKYNPAGPPPPNPFTDLATAVGVGELDERSVDCALYHLAFGDQGIKIDAKTIFNVAELNHVNSFGEEWLNIAASRPGTDRVKIGKVLGLEKIAPVETGPADFTKVTATNIPTFTWDKNGSNDFKIQFFTADMTKVVHTTAALGDVATFTPDAAEWAKIFDGHTAVKWVVEGRDTTNPATPGSVADSVYTGNLDRYWSDARTLNGPSIALVIDNTGSMSNEIDAVKASLDAFITSLQASLSPGEDAPTVELVTFVDGPTSQISSNNLDAVRAAVDAMSADGGGDIPEPSAVSLQFASTDIGPGGTILLVTDAPSDPGSDLSGTIAALRAKGVNVNADISGDESGGAEAAALFSAVSSASLSATSSINLSPSASTGTLIPADTTTAPPDDDGAEPAQTSFTDPGQTPIDDVGNTPAAGTTLVADGFAFSGVVGNSVQDASGNPVTDSDDYFALGLTAGIAYNIPVYTDPGGFVDVTLFNTDGTTSIQSTSTSTGDLGFGAVTVRYTPTVTGTYFLDISGGSSNAYTVRVSSNPVVGATSSVTLFSTVTNQTGGAFFYKPNVAGSPSAADTTDYEAGIQNVMDSTFEPVVLSASPNNLPAGVTMNVTLTGRKTNWLQNFSTVSFAGGGITVNGVTVTSPTSLNVSVTIGAGAATAFSNVTVKTILGSKTESATGVNVAQTTPAITSATLLQVQPSGLARGGTATLIVHGVLTSWDSTSTVSFGPGITVTSAHVDSATQITAQVQVDPAAAIGFRVATVTTGSNPDTQDMALQVFADALASVPAVTSLSVSGAFDTQHADVAVTGSNTHFAAGSTTATFGAGVNVTSVDVIDATHAVVHLDVAADATAGFRDVTLSTGTETAALLNGFFVQPTVPLTLGAPAGPVDAPLPFVTGFAAFTVTIPTAQAAAITVDFATSDGTAVAGVDYTASTGTLTIPAGTTSGVIEVPLLAQSATQAAKTFTLTLSNPSAGGVISNSSATGTIAARTVVATPFVKHQLKYTDSLGLIVRLVQGGAGTATAYFVDGSADPADIAIDGSTAGTSLSIIAAVKSPAPIGGIGVNGPLGTLSAANTVLNGDIVIGGNARSLLLGSNGIAGDSIVISGGGPAATHMALKTADGLSVTTSEPLGAVTATSWAAGTITAPSLGSLTVGALGATLNIAGLVKTVHTTGAISGGTWNLGGLTSLTAAGGTAAAWTANVTGNVGTIVARMFDGALTSGALVKAIKVVGEMSAAVTAQSFGSITVGGAVSGRILSPRRKLER